MTVHCGRDQTQKMLNANTGALWVLYPMLINRASGPETVVIVIIMPLVIITVIIVGAVVPTVLVFDMGIMTPIISAELNPRKLFKNPAGNRRCWVPIGPQTGRNPIQTF